MLAKMSAKMSGLIKLFNERLEKSPLENGINIEKLSKVQLLGLFSMATIVAIVAISLAVSNQTPTTTQPIAEKNLNKALNINLASFDLLVMDGKTQLLNLRSASERLALVNSPIASIHSYSVEVEGVSLAAFKNRNEAQMTLDELLLSASREDILVDAKGFNESFSISEKRVSATKFSKFANVNATIQIIKKGKSTSENYVIKEQDTLGLIASQNGISIDQLNSMNPEISSQKYLKVGQHLKIKHEKPYLSTKIVGERVAKNEVKPTDVYVNSDKLYIGETKVLEAGKSQIVESRLKLTLVNGEIVDKTIISQITIQKMEPNTIAKGTKQIVIAKSNSKVSSNLGRPARKYMIFSRYGKRGSGFHTGIDLSMPSGSPIYSAESGTVVFSGNQGSYGLVVTIDHGKGIKTLYSHNSKNLVSVGDVIEKGQLIAKSGQTGRATGPHLHFEVRKNNIPLNPERFLNF